MTKWFLVIALGLGSLTAFAVRDEDKLAQFTAPCIVSTGTEAEKKAAYQQIDYNLAQGLKLVAVTKVDGKIGVVNLCAYTFIQQ